MTECDVYKERGYTGCLRAAFDLVCSNFVRLVRRTWLPALLFAACMALSVSLDEPLALLLPAVGGCLALCWTCSRCMGEVVEAGGGRLFARFLKVAVLNFLVVLLFELLALSAAALVHKLSGGTAETQQPPGVGLYLLVFFVVMAAMLVALVPTGYSALKYIVDPAARLRSVYGKGYRTGWKSWGYLFVTEALAALIAIIILSVACLPSAVLLSAERINAVGVALGDSSALPDKFLLMRFAAAALASLVYACLTVWYLLVMYFAYGRIEARLKDKEKATQQQ